MTVGQVAQRRTSSETSKGLPLPIPAVQSFDRHPMRQSGLESDEVGDDPVASVSVQLLAIRPATLGRLLDTCAF